VNPLRAWLDNEFKRRAWVEAQLKALPAGALILDAGCGSQQYRPFCAHLRYEAQDFGQVALDEKDSFAARGQAYSYGPLDYTGDIWQIPVEAGRFDAVLCTEVLEHIPYPARTLAELGRVLKPGGKLILTLPANSLRHMDPYWFYPGLSDRWLERQLPELGFEIVSLEAQGDYHSWMRLELARGMKLQPWTAPFLLSAFAWHALAALWPTPASRASLCEGYHVVARRKAGAAQAAHD
jgi:SAM-dependent methyltransferase